MSRSEGTPIAVIEDDPDIGAMLCDVLEEGGYRSFLFARADTFETTLENQHYALCLVDLGLPDQNGLDLVRALSTRYAIPCIIISGRQGLTDKIVGLELGADDYVAKPFELPEILARVRSVLRRVGREQALAEGEASLAAGQAARHAAAQHADITVSFDEWTLDYGTFELTHSDGTSERLSSAEMAVLKVFLDTPNRLLSRSQILDQVAQSGTELFDRAVDVRISRLRAKLRENTQQPTLIKTVYGAGYIFTSKVQRRPN